MAPRTTGPQRRPSPKDSAASKNGSTEEISADTSPDIEETPQNTQFYMIPLPVFQVVCQKIGLLPSSEAGGLYTMLTQYQPVTVKVAEGESPVE